MDALIAVSNQLKNLNQHHCHTNDELKKTTSQTKQKQATTLAMLQPDEAVKPGETTIVYMQFQHIEENSTIKVSLKKNDLLGRIIKNNIKKHSN